MSPTVINPPGPDPEKVGNGETHPILNNVLPLPPGQVQSFYDNKSNTENLIKKTFKKVYKMTQISITLKT